MCLHRYVYIISDLNQVVALQFKNTQLQPWFHSNTFIKEEMEEQVFFRKRDLENSEFFYR